MGKRKSGWLESAQQEDSSVKPCSTCDGTGWKDQSTGTVCGSCRGFGY
jgi:DnaJ-class molecular chaperone